MNNSLKMGITMTSLVVYIVVFSTLTLVLSMIYTNMNENLFASRGESINYTTFNKLQYNLTKSALESNNVFLEGNLIRYSNGDVYLYDDTEDIILLNGGILCSNVTGFNPVITEGINAKKVEINVIFNKYSDELNRNIVSSVEVN